MIKRITLSIISFTILLSCSDDNPAKEENIIDEDLIICETSNTKKLLVTQYSDLNLIYSYNDKDYLEHIRFQSPAYERYNDYKYNTENQLTTKTDRFYSRELTEIEIDSFQYNSNGELIKHKFKNKSYYTDGPDAETVIDSSMHENNFVYNANLIKRNSSNYIRLNEDKEIETIFLDLNEITFQYDSNGNIISGTGKINDKDINVRFSYECFIKHPIFEVHTFNHILTNEYPIWKLRELFEDLVDLGFQYPTSIEWEITGEGNYEVTYEYDFDLEGYPERKETVYSTNSRPLVYYQWED